MIYFYVLSGQAIILIKIVIEMVIEIVIEIVLQILRSLCIKSANTWYRIATRYKISTINY